MVDATDKTKGFKTPSTNTNPADPTYLYTYDAVGNRLTGPGAKDTSYNYGPENHQLAGRVFNYSYDHAGNQVSRSTNSSSKGWTHTWDYTNRLIKAEQLRFLLGLLVFAVATRVGLDLLTKPAELFSVISLEQGQ